MAGYRTVKISFWTDPYIEELPSNGKLLYMYLFTSPYTNNLGVVETTMRRMSYETGIDQKTIGNLLADMETNGKIIRDGNYIWLPRFIRHQCSTSPKLIQSLKGILFELSSAKIRNAICARYPDVFDFTEEEKQRLDTVSEQENTENIPYAYGTDTVSIPCRELKEIKKNLKEKEINNARTRDDARPERQKYGQFQNVLLTENEHARLVAQFGEEKTASMIERLDGYIASKGVKYKSHYATMLNWERMDKEKEQAQANPFKFDLSFAHEERHV